ncbi:MAG: hypothetical protein AABY86_12135 [Bdellovibrionota bacterium]
MRVLKNIFIILLTSFFTFFVLGASAPVDQNLQLCQCKQKFQAHFYKDSKNKLDFQVSKATCICEGKPREITAICPTKKRSLRKFMTCARDTTISAELSSPESVELPSNSEGTSHETQIR